MENKKEICEYCDNEANSLQAVQSASVCESCVTENFSPCSDCNDLTDNSDIEHYSSVGKDLCSMCADNYEYCGDCSEFVDADDLQAVSWHQMVCSSCISNYFTCDRCENTYNSSDYYCENGLCNDCFSRDIIKPWDTNVLDYCKPDKESRLFGFELEVGCDTNRHDVDRLAKETNEIVSKDAILKSDGSISTGDYDGFEIVTRPMNFENQVGFWSDFVEKKNAALRSWELGSCGLHIHTSRKPLTPLTIGKLLVFVNGNENRDFMTHIARRTCEDYAQFKNKKLTDGRKSNGNRYEAINLCNEKTIEFRIFRGSTKLETILTALEFVNVSLDFAQQTSIQNLGYKDFIKFVNKTKGNNNLKAHIEKYESKQAEKAKRKAERKTEQERFNIMIGR